MPLTISNSNDERRSVGVSVTASEKARVVVRHQQTSDSERNHVEYEDTPEHLLDGFGQFDPGVLRLGRRETDEFGS